MSDVAPEPMIHARGLVKRFGDFVAVDGIDLDVMPGEAFGFLGPNGAGKTTTMECVEGNRVPDAGTISVLGLDPRRDANALRQRIGVQHQEAQLQKRIELFDLSMTAVDQEFRGGRAEEDPGAIGDDLRAAVDALRARNAERWPRLLGIGLAMPGIVAGSLLVFTLSASSFVTPNLLGGTRIQVLAASIYKSVTQTLDWPFAAAQAVILFAGVLLVLIPYAKMTARHDG